MYNHIILVAIIVLALIFILSLYKESMMDIQTYQMLMDLPFTQAVRIRGHNPNEYFGYGYLTNKSGPKAALGNSVRILGQETTNPRIGTTPSIAYQNYFRNK